MGPRRRDGRAGWQVITPLRLDGGDTVLIDRGWVPESLKEPRSRPEGQIDGPVRFSGYIYRARPRAAFAPDNDPAKGEWYWMDPPAMAAQLDLSRAAPFWIAAARDPDRRAGPVGMGEVTMPVNNHLGYAITWYALAFSLSVLAVAYWRQSFSTD